ncbi:MAG: YfcE family phosphodiesterase [Planctomicrobium sp.]|jgi:uncharacterized protein|nr:YfcE family phosphodiesterase [Planctomicrobium sp.]
MRLGVVSDTHGNLTNTAKAVQLLRELNVEVVIHCGDIGSPAVVHEFAEWSTHFVFGNVDQDPVLLEQAIRDAEQNSHQRFGELILADRKIAFLHSDDQRRFQETIHTGEYDLVCYGHTHNAESHTEGRTLVLNPGAIHRANPHTIATVDLSTMLVEHHPLEPNG